MRLALGRIIALGSLGALGVQAFGFGPDCVRDADYLSINKMFSDGGPGTKVFLCPGAQYALHGAIVFTAADQELATLGYPSGDERAVLHVDSEQAVTAVQGDCRRCARVAVRNLVIDGARRRFGRVRDPNNAPGLVIIGGNEGQAVRECAISDPRGFTAVHVREGAKLNCRGAVIERNEIAGVGEEYDPEYDGPDPEMSPWGRPLADGISIACRDATVRDNVVNDCTDAGIVVYCSPGTIIEGNHISTHSRSAIGGILLVDETPFNGDYSGVIVKDNDINAAQRTIRVGIGIGLSILSDDIDTRLKGGSVLGNRLRGPKMGYGIAASGLTGWTIKGNVDDARHSGAWSPRCFDEPANPPPQPYIYNKGTMTKSSVQSEFVDSDFAYIVCIDGVDETPMRYTTLEDPKRDAMPGPELLSPGMGKEKEAVDVGGDASEPGEEDTDTEDDDKNILTGNEVLDGILLHAQQRVLESIGDVGGRVEKLVLGTPQEGHQAGGMARDSDSDSSDLTSRLANLEKSQKSLLSLTRSLQSKLKTLRADYQDIGLWEGDVVLSIKQEFENSIQPSNEDHDVDDDDNDYPAGVYTHLRSPIVWVFLFLGAGAGITLATRRLFRRPKHTKIV